MRKFFFPVMMLIGWCLTAAALAEPPAYSYTGLGLDMAAADVATALGDSTEDNTSLDWTVENDLGVMLYEAESGKALLAMLDQGHTVLVMVVDMLEPEAYAGLIASYTASWGAPATAPPDFALKHDIFMDYETTAQDVKNPAFWGDAESQRVMATEYDPETTSFYLLLVDVDDSIKADVRMETLSAPTEEIDAPEADTEPMEGETPPAEGSAPPAPAA